MWRSDRPLAQKRVQSLLRLADRYDVQVIWIERSYEIPFRSRGPQEGGCDPKKRCVYFDRDLTWGDYGPEVYLHELAHVIVQPPWDHWTIKKTPEEFVLFQFERAVARALFDESALFSVIAWQEDTYLGHPHFKTHRVLQGIPSYQQSPIWKSGFARCRTLGLLNAKNRPTYRKPNWHRLEGQRKILENLYRIR